MGIKEIKISCDMCGGIAHYKGNDIKEVVCECGNKFNVGIIEQQKKE